MAGVEQQRPPVVPRVLAVLAVAGLGAALGVATFLVASEVGLRASRYPGLSPRVSVSYALVGTLLAAVAWREVRHRARRPRTVLAWSVGAVTAVSLGADVVNGLDTRLLASLATAGQHVAVIAATVAVLAWAMPVPPDPDDRAVPSGWATGLAPSRRRVLAAVLVVAAGVWAVVNKAVEGPTLLVITPRHGLTTADLLSITALLVAAHLLRPRRGRPRRRTNPT
jgi:hypothetical protein